MDLNISCNNLEINSSTSRLVNVTINGVDEDDILVNIPIAKIVQFYGSKDLLEEIGIEECKGHFDLIEDSIENHRNILIDHILDS